ncbi:hypothetical protein ABZX85_35745 [Streptomyces sp. NPDC004539]|uniref:hypothetical protein n=1 Tax=Streptomyces sp. NPDC004539 TaxID=3154280 RepID=UPI0033A399AB
MGNVAVERRNGDVPVQYHQFDIKDEDGPTGPELNYRQNGIIGVLDGVIVVTTGIHTGSVDVDIALHETEPAPDDGAWEEIVEISARSVSGDLQVRGMMDDLDEELPVLAFQGPGDYRLRLHARGRDTAIDLAPDEITEWYLVQVWPEPTRPMSVLRQTDRFGASNRG